MTDQPQRVIPTTTSPIAAGHVVRVPAGTVAEPTTDPAVLGFIVLIHDDGKRPGWHHDWDGEVHPDLGKARQSLAEARKAGYAAVLAEQRAMEGE